MQAEYHDIIDVLHICERNENEADTIIEATRLLKQLRSGKILLIAFAVQNVLSSHADKAL